MKYIFIIGISFSFLTGKSQQPKQKFKEVKSQIDTIYPNCFLINQHWSSNPFKLDASKNSNSQNQFYKITSRRPNGDTVIFWAPQPFESDSVRKNSTFRIHHHDWGISKDDSTRLSIQSGKEDMQYYLFLKNNKQFEYSYVDSLYNSGFRIDTNEFYKLHRERPIKLNSK